MSDSLEKLVKEIDALTYNARSVMNALNRSAIASSSSNGFTITRAGEKLTLTRPLIYRLSKFYEEWANNSFWVGPPVDALSSSGLKPFDLILKDHDLIPIQDANNVVVIPSPTTEALVVHSKILFLTPDNISNLNDKTYWVNLLKTSANPKLITNSAPIPLNIRTPIFDENLSTTRFLSHESYLFPYAYFALDTLGYTGDVTNHQLAGLSWEIIADDFIRLMATKISMGGMIPEAFFKTWAARVGDYALAWGYDTNARGGFSTAGGINTFATASSSISIGSSSISSGDSAITLGVLNTSSGAYSAVVGGLFNAAVANFSGVFIGSHNIAGEEIFPWIFNVTTKDICTIDSNGVPVKTTVNDATNKTTLIVNSNIIGKINPLDQIRLFDFTMITSLSGGNRFFDKDGNGFNSIVFIVRSIALDALGNTIITIDNPGVPYESVDGGSLSLYYVNSTGLFPGKNSFATGEYNIASGEDQAVVGKFNKKISTARFIVGAGSGTDDASRKNSFLVGDDYISGFVTSDDNIDSDTSFGFKLDPTRSIIRRGRSKIEINDTLSQLSLYQSNVVPVGNESAMLFDTGKVVIYAQKEAQLTSETLLTLTSLGNTVINTTGILTINSGSTVSNTGALTLNWSSLSLNGPTYGSLPTTDKQYSHIVKSGDPFISTSISFIDRSGFYAVNEATTDFDTFPVPLPYTDISAQDNKFWLLNITHKEVSNNPQNRYETWQMIFGRQTGIPTSVNNDPNIGLHPTNPLYRDTDGHIMVRRTYNGDDINGAGGRYTSWRKLAWIEDIIGSSPGGVFINNDTVVQTGNFNISGLGKANILETVASAIVGTTLTVGTPSALGSITANGNIIVNGLVSNPQNITINNGNLVFGTALAGAIGGGIKMTGYIDTSVIAGIENAGNAWCGLTKKVSLWTSGAVTIKTTAITSKSKILITAVHFDDNNPDPVPVSPHYYGVFGVDDSLNQFKIRQVNLDIDTRFYWFIINDTTV